METKAHDKAIKGGLQGWSVKAPYPFVVMAIDNPAGYPEGLYWYVVDSRKGSHSFKDRIGNACTGPKGAEYAHCHASAMYRRHIEGASIHEAAEEYKPWWALVRRVEQQDGVFKVMTVNPFVEF